MKHGQQANQENILVIGPSWIGDMVMAQSLKTENFTRAIVLPNSFKSALIPFYADIPRRIAWRGEWRNLLLTDFGKLNKGKFPLMVRRFSALADSGFDEPLRAIAKPQLHIDPVKVAATLEEFELQSGGKILALCPGAEFGKAKQWPAEHYASACNSLIAEGWKVWIFGSPNDKVIA